VLEEQPHHMAHAGFGDAAQIGREVGTAAEQRGDDLERRKVRHPRRGRGHLLGRHAQHGLGQRGRDHHMAVLGRGHQRHRRDRQHDGGARVDVAQQEQELRQVGHDLVHAMVLQHMAIGVEAARHHTGADRVDRAVACIGPGLGQAQREDEHVQFGEQPAHGGEVLFPVRLQGLPTAQPTAMGAWAEGVDPAPIGLLPGAVQGLKFSEGAQHQLQQLARGVDVAIACAEVAVAPGRCQIGGYQRMRRFGDERLDAVLSQVAGHVLRKTAPGGGDAGVARYAEGRAHHGVHQRRVDGGRAGDPTRPVAVVGQVRVGVRRHARACCSTSRP
jgi:hypothetical protein